MTEITTNYDGTLLFFTVIGYLFCFPTPRYRLRRVYMSIYTDTYVECTIVYNQDEEWCSRVRAWQGRQSCENGEWRAVSVLPCLTGTIERSPIHLVGCPSEVTLSRS